MNTLIERAVELLELVGSGALVVIGFLLLGLILFALMDRFERPDDGPQEGA